MFGSTFKRDNKTDFDRSGMFLGIIDFNSRIGSMNSSSNSLQAHKVKELSYF